MPPRPILLVHGAWHGAWCWAALQAELDRRGVASWAVDLPGHGVSIEPLGDLLADAEHVVGTLAVIDEHAGDEGVVLVGHSYGGGVITQAAALALDKGLPIAHLVYLTAFAPNDGESVTGAYTALPREDTPLNGLMQRHDDGTFSARSAEAAADVFYGRCTPEQAAAAWARLSRQSAASLMQPVAGDPRAKVPSTYVVCTEDRAIHPNHQRLMAERCGATVELATDHSPFLSMPSETADLLTTIAAR